VVQRSVLYDMIRLHSGECKIVSSGRGGEGTFEGCVGVAVGRAH
jgi:hypothetical protein